MIGRFAISLAVGFLALAEPTRADVDLWPLLELSPDSTTVLYPFYVRSRHSESEDGLWIGWRLFGWNRTSSHTHYFGGYLFDYGYGEGNWNADLFPLLWAWGGESKRGIAILPAYWSRSESTSV